MLSNVACTHAVPAQGPAVWALRAQTDKLEYARVMRKVLEETPNLSIREVGGRSYFWGRGYGVRHRIVEGLQRGCAPEKISWAEESRAGPACSV